MQMFIDTEIYQKLKDIDKSEVFGGWIETDDYQYVHCIGKTELNNKLFSVLEGTFTSKELYQVLINTINYEDYTLKEVLNCVEGYYENLEDLLSKSGDAPLQILAEILSEMGLSDTEVLKGEIATKDALKISLINLCK